MIVSRITLFMSIIFSLICTASLVLWLSRPPITTSEWALIYATTNSSQAYWRLYLADLERDVTFPLLDETTLLSSRPVLSPDGRFAIDGENEPMLLYDLYDETVQTLERGIYPVWSAAGNQVAYIWHSQLFVQPIVEGEIGQPEFITDDAGLLVGWSPTDETIAYLRQSELFLLDVQTGENRTLGADDAMIVYMADWSPDGRYMVYASRFKSDGGRYQIYTVDVTSGETHLLFDFLSRVESVAWSPAIGDTWRITFTEINGNMRQIRIITLLPDASTPIHELVIPVDARQLQWTPDGKRLLLINQRDSDIYIIDAIGSNLRRLTDNDTYNVLLR